MTKSLLDNWLMQLEKIDTMHELNSFKASVLGKSGVINSEMKKLASMHDEEKREFGMRINQMKNEIERHIAERKTTIECADVANALKAESIDVTLPCMNGGVGKLHVITMCMQSIREYYMSCGFVVVEGSEVDTDFFNFYALNIPVHHPARQNSDTFYVDGYDDVLLRTQTSTAQIHAMLDMGVPIRMLSMGKVYRNDSLDATHSPMFHQIEGLVVDENPISVRHMKSELQKMLAFVFECDIGDVAVRLRPSYFPFTEPGVEVDCRYKVENGKIVLSHAGDRWMEIAGAGMVHPSVFEACRLPRTLFGFAFGFGLERIAMLKYGVSDIRTLYG